MYNLQLQEIMTWLAVSCSLLLLVAVVSALLYMFITRKGIGSKFLQRVDSGNECTVVKHMQYFNIKIILIC